MGETLFISDLHLDSSRPEITQLFLNFLRDSTRDIDALYILGDLFEVWFGDDDPSEAVAEIKSALANLNAPLFLMHGNRDFLIGEQFCKETGATLLSDPSVIDLYGRKTLLMHGDTLCTDDHAYMTFRKKVRDLAFINSILSLDIATRIEQISQIRKKSQESMQEKKLEIMDANQDEVVSVMRNHQVDRLIHGHTHRPAIHNFSIDGNETTRIVLGDWYKPGSVLHCSKQGCELETIEA